MFKIKKSLSDLHTHDRTMRLCFFCLVRCGWESVKVGGAGKRENWKFMLTSGCCVDVGVGVAAGVMYVMEISIFELCVTWSATFECVCNRLTDTLRLSKQSKTKWCIVRTCKDMDYMISLSSFLNDLESKNYSIFIKYLFLR